MFAQTYGRLVVCLACIDIGKWLTWHCSSSHVHKRLKDRGFWGVELQRNSRNQWHRRDASVEEYHWLPFITHKTLPFLAKHSQQMLNLGITSNGYHGSTNAFWVHILSGTWSSCFDHPGKINTHTDTRLLNISCLRNITLPMEIVPFDILGHLILFGQIHIMVSSSGSCLLCIVMQYHRSSFMHLNSLMFVTKNTQGRIVG